MTRWHIVIEDDDNNIVGQFDVKSDSRRENIKDNIPSDLSIRNERRIDDEANLRESLETLSDNVVHWDERLIDL